MRTLALLAILGIGCTERVSVIAASGDIAVGARFRFAVVDSKCDDSGATSFTVSLGAGLAIEAFLTSEGRPILALPPISTAPSCRKVRIDRVSEVTSSDPATLAVVDSTADQGIGLVEVEARAAGSAEIQITVETPGGPRTTSTTLHAARIAHVELNRPNPCPSGTEEGYIAIGAFSSYKFALTGENGQSLLGYGYLPIIGPPNLDLKYATSTDSKGRPTTNFGLVYINWPMQTGDLTLTSPEDRTFRKMVTLYDQSAYTAVEFSPDATTIVDLTNANGVRFDAKGRTGSRTSCSFDPIKRHYFIDTPQVCNIALGLGSPNTTDLTASGVVVRGLTAGTCRLHAEVPNTAFAPTIDLTVR